MVARSGGRRGTTTTMRRRAAWSAAASPVAWARSAGAGASASSSAARAHSRGPMRRISASSSELAPATYTAISAARPGSNAVTWRIRQGTAVRGTVSAPRC